MARDWRRHVPDPVRLILCLAAIAAALIVGIRAATPPAAVPADAPATQFSSARAMADIARISVSPHPTGSAENAYVAGILARRLSALGMEVERRRYLIDDDTRARLMSWSGGQLAPNELENVLGVLPGRDRTLPAIMLTAHYDTVWGSPGAADDGIGVATALEAVRAIRARGRPLRDVVVLFTDGEETGLGGARAFWGEQGIARRIGAVINLEARGAGGRAVMFETGRDNGGMIALLSRAVPRPVASSLATLAYRMMPNSTDFTVARGLGVPGFNFAVVARARYYHSPAAIPAIVDPRSVQDMGDQALPLAAALAGARTLPAPAADATFFDLPGGKLVHYATRWGWAVILFGAAATALAWRRARPPADAIAGGTLTGLWALAMGALVLSLLNLISGAAAHPDYYAHLAALPRLETQAAFGLAAVLLGAAMLRATPARIAGLLPPLLLGLAGMFAGAPPAMMLVPGLLAGLFWVAMPREGAGAWGGWIGLNALVLFLATAAQVAAPEAAWILAWPALTTGAALFLASLLGRTLPVLVIAAAAAAAVAASLLPVAHLIMLNIGAGLPEVIALFAPVMLAAFWPLARMRPGIPATIAMSACLLLAAATALSVRLETTSGTAPAYGTDKKS